jgi:hypothetical protein
MRLSVDGAVADTQPIVIERKPGNVTVRDEDLQRHVALALEARDRASMANQAIVDIRSLKGQIPERVKEARSPAVGLAADVVDRKLTEVEAMLATATGRHRPPAATGPPLTERFAALRKRIEEELPPEETTRAALADLSAELDAALASLAGVLSNEVAAFNRLLTNATLDPLVLPDTLPAAKPR